jgi:hypothetical protein
MQHNLEQAREFLTLLTGEEDPSVTWQLFYDAKRGVQKPELAQYFNKTLNDALPLIKWSQDRYCGIYVTLNETDGEGRKNKNVTRYRAVFADFDGMEEPVWLLKPHFVTKRDATHGHAFWLVSDINTPEQFMLLQKRVAMVYKTDPQVTDPARVVRVAGFNHYKNPLNPAQYAIADDNTDDDHKYSVLEIEQLLAPITAKQDAELESWLLSKKGDLIGAGYENNETYNKQFVKWLTTSAPVAIQGSGTHTLISVALWAHDHGILLETTTGLMWNNYNSRCIPPWDITEKSHFEAVIKRGYQYSKSAAGCKVSTAQFKPVTEPLEGWEANNKRNVIVPQITNVEEATENLVANIRYLIKKDSGLDVEVDAHIIQSMLNSCFYSPQKNSYNLLSSNDNLIEAKHNDKWSFLTKTFGSPIDYNATAKALDEALKQMKLTKTEGSKLKKLIISIPANQIAEHIRYFNQRSTISMEVDMFANKGRIEIHDEHAQIVFTHKKLPENSFDKSVVNDYKEHFPQFLELISWLVNCRFASDRKLAYLWIHADSDFGKGFFLAVLDYFKLGVDISTKEIEKIFEGSPVGRQMTDFKRASVIVVDEFKSVKSELKLLQNSMTISPKNQLAIKVNLYSKIFTSAEHVSSLVGDAGIEDQFANRFNYLRCKGSINKRKMFSAIGKSKYIESIKGYFAQEFNKLVDGYISMGKEASTLKADEELIKFHQTYGIGNEFDTLSKSLPEIANDIKEYAVQSCGYLIVRDTNNVYLKCPAKVIEQYITNTYDHSNKPMLLKKKNDIRDLMSIDNKGCTTYRVNSQESIKAVRLQ